MHAGTAAARSRKLTIPSDTRASWQRAAQTAASTLLKKIKCVALHCWAVKWVVGALAPCHAGHLGRFTWLVA